VSRLRATSIVPPLAFAAALLAAGGAAAGDTVQAPSWLGPMAGVRLFAVDGSTLTVTPDEGGFVLAVASASGAAQRMNFAYLGDRLGTISDDTEPGRVVGFFRQTDGGLDVEFGDGRSQFLALNSAGGFSLTLKAPNGKASCSAWYPEGHVFGAAERRAALAAYAQKLGIPEHGKSAARAPIPACPPPAQTAKHLPSPVSPGPYKIGMYSAAEVTTSGAAAPAIAVRTSTVHPIDPDPAPNAALPPLAVSVPAAAAPAVQSAASAAPKLTLASAVQDGHGASDCLSVENDNGNIGFRNRCSFGVQFAYCLQKGNEGSGDCSSGTKTGDVAPNGFALLIANIDIKDAEHEFHWVACSGSPGSVVAHLDRAEPPAGRCERLNAS